ncbi:hypothetical protein PHYPO_G00153020 [Pangasianodon hypophthalmus]|uniref:Uncharacterized protein n=1 Tax=Pangasianodon hypophthalmus TaxID=310915 RepID=A0A5N5JW72_PANHP|nr:hypothetical protein PHYPO_G00153020 [Pangasianodon hypophthalmus]
MNNLETEVIGGENAGMSWQELRCFRDILDVVLNLNDEEWKALTKDMPNVGTRMEYAGLCTRIVISVLKSAIERYLTIVIEVMGIESLLIAQEKLKEKGENVSKGAAATPDSRSSSEERSVDLSDFICDSLDSFVNSVKMAMQEAIWKTASGKTLLFAENWKTCSHVTREMLHILLAKLKPSRTEAQLRSEAQVSLNTEAIAGKVVLVVLEDMEGTRVGRLDLKQSRDLLIAASEQIKHLASLSSSVESLNKKEKAQLSHQHFQTEAHRAVSQVLLINTGVLEMDTSDSDLPHSHTCQAELSDALLVQVDSTSRDIVETVKSHLDILASSGYSEAKGAGFISVIHHMFHTVHEKVKMFFKVSRKPVKENVTENFDTVQQKSSTATSTTSSETLVDKPDRAAKSEKRTSSHLSQLDSEVSLRSHQIIQGVMQALENLVNHSSNSQMSEVSRAKQEEDRYISRPGSGIATDERASGVPSTHQTVDVSSKQFNHKTVQTVSDILLKPGKEAVDRLESATFVTVESVASDIMEDFVKDLEKMSSSNQMNHGQNQSVTEPTPSQHFADQRFYKRMEKKVFGFLLRLQKTPQVFQEETSAQRADPENLSVSTPSPHLVSPKLQDKFDQTAGEETASSEHPELCKVESEMPSTSHIGVSTKALHSTDVTECSSTVPEMSTDQVMQIYISENGTIFEKPYSVPDQFQRSGSDRARLENMASDAYGPPNLASNIKMDFVAGPSHTIGSSWDSKPVAPCGKKRQLNNPVLLQALKILAEETVKHLFVHFHSLKPSKVAEQLASLASSFQNKPDFNKLTGFPHDVPEAVSQFTETLTDSVIKSLTSTVEVTSEAKLTKAFAERIPGTKSPDSMTTPSNKSSTSLVDENLDSLWRQESHCCQIPNNGSISLDPAPEVQRRASWIRFIAGKKAYEINKKKRPIVPMSSNISRPFLEIFRRIHVENQNLQDQQAKQFVTVHPGRPQESPKP